MRQAILLLAGVGLGIVGSLVVHGQPPPRPEAKSLATQPKAVDESRDSLCDIPADVTEPRFVDPERHEATKRWELMLRQRVTFEFKDAMFEEVLRVLSEMTGYQFEIDSQKLTDEGVDLDKLRFTLVVKDWQIKTALKKLLQPHQLDYLVDDYSEEIVMITTAVCCTEKLTTKIYPVADLVNYRIDDQVMLAHEELTERIQQSVQPDSWDSVGGEGSILFVPVSLSLIVRQTRAIHDETEGFMTTLRQVRCRASTLLKATGSPTLEEIRKAQDSFARAQSEVTRLEIKLRDLETIDPEGLNLNQGFGGGFFDVSATPVVSHSPPGANSILRQLSVPGEYYGPDAFLAIAKRARMIAVRAVLVAQRMEILRTARVREQEIEHKKVSEKPLANPESPKAPPSPESKP
jgi:hypothetical protein